MSPSGPPLGPHATAPRGSAPAFLQTPSDGPRTSSSLSTLLRKPIDLADDGGGAMRGLGPRDPAVIRIDALWLSVEPMDMRVGAERLLARVVQVFGEARAPSRLPVCANARASRVKLLVHDGFGVWCCARRLNTGGFLWPKPTTGNRRATLTLTQQQFDALVVGLPWQRLPQSQVITRM
jgi:transposase